MYSIENTHGAWVCANPDPRSAECKFKDEYLEMLKRFDIEYDTRYLFNWIEDES